MSQEHSIASALEDRRIPRRRFLKFCSAMAATLALPPRYAAEIAKKLESARRPIVLWREFQDCAGNTESMLRSSHPDIAEIVLEILSLEYHETIMAGAGKFAEAAAERVIKEEKGNYIAIVEGAIPAADGGVYCTIGGRTALDLVRELCLNAKATLAVGACAWDGGLVAASPNPTGAIGVQEAVPGATVVNLGGCPHNAENTVAVIVHYLTFGQLPALDQYNRPLFAYGRIIHDQCERRAHYDAGRFVQEWGDDGHRRGWCLYKMGCKGPEATYNCPSVRWNGQTSWPVKAGHGCIACASNRFWDTRSPFYDRLPSVPGFGVDVSAEQIGLVLAGAAIVTTATHGLVSIVKHHEDIEALKDVSHAHVEARAAGKKEV